MKPIVPLTVVCALAVGPALSGPVDAAVATWEPPVNLGSAGRYGGGVDVAVAPDGRAVAVWTRSKRRHNQDTLMAASRSARGGWSDPIVLAPEARGHEFPSVAFDAKGAATVVWQDYGERGRVSVESRRITRTGSLTRTVRLGRMDGGGGLPSLAVDPVGNATVAWSKQDGTRAWVEVVRRPAGGSWTDPKRLSPRDGDVGLPTVAASSGGTVVVWPGAASYGRPARVWAARRAEGWQDPEPVSARGSVFGAEAAVAETGAILATWSRYPADGPARVEVAERPAGGDWRPAALLPSGEDGLDPVVTTGDDGDATVVWRMVTGKDRYRTAATTRADGGAWEAPTLLSPPGRDAWHPQVVMDGAGAVTVVWQENVAGDSRGESIGAAHRDPVAGWLPTESLSTGEEAAAQPALGVAGDGSVTAVWTRLDGRNRVSGSRLR